MRQHIVVGRLKINDKESGVNDTYVFRAKRLKMERFVCSACGDSARKSSLQKTVAFHAFRMPDVSSAPDLRCQYCATGVYAKRDVFGIKLYTTIPVVVDGVKLLCGRDPVLECGIIDSLSPPYLPGSYAATKGGLWLRPQYGNGGWKWPKKRKDLYKVFLDGGPVSAHEQLKRALGTMGVTDKKKKMAEWILVKVPTNEELTEVYELYAKAKFAEVL